MCFTVDFVWMLDQTGPVLQPFSLGVETKDESSDVVVLLALAVVPDSDRQTLLGEVNNVGHEDELFVELRIHRSPLHCCFLPTLSSGLWHQNTAKTNNKNNVQKYFSGVENTKLLKASLTLEQRSQLCSVQDLTWPVRDI